MIQVATRSPARTAATLSICVCTVCGWTAQVQLGASDELEGTLGKSTESLLLGDGDALLRFFGIVRQAGTVKMTG